MRKAIYTSALLFGAFVAAVAIPQVAPSTLPSSTVWGRLGISAGPGQAIPFTILTQQVNAVLGILSLKSYGAVGDGTTNDTAAISTANAIAGPNFAPPGTYATTLASTALDGPYWGFGQIRTGATNKRAPYFSAIKGNLSYTASNEDSIETAFNGDFTRSLFPAEHRITGAATLTQPTSGYVYSPWATPYYTYLYNDSGWNNGTADNTGRTAATAHRTKVFHVGQGDAVAYNASAFVNSTRAGSTSFLANPAAVLFNGDMTAGQAGVYLNAGELSLDDAGFDVAGIGWVVNMNRSVATGAKNAWWAGFRAQSIGSANVNAALSASGKYNVGLDFSSITTDASKAWAAVKADDRLYLNSSSSNGYYATSLGTEYLTYSSSLTALNVVIGNSSAFQVYSDHVAIPGTALFSGSTSGTTTLKASAIASGTMTLPAATDTLVGLSATQSLTNKTIDGPSITVNSGNPTFLTYKATGVNFNSGNTDTAISINLPTGFTRFTVNRVMISHASGTLTTSTFGVFTAATGGGTAIIAGGTANTVSTASEGTINNTMLNAGSNSTSFLLASVPNIYFRVQTAQGVAATADVMVAITPLP